jgi:copper chaperone NosL
MDRTPAHLGRLARALAALGALVPLLTFMFPLWHYYFEAPQYPEGLGMSIWSFKLAGKVDSINNLNHYVGFMHLEPTGFPELWILPIAIGLLAVTGALVATLGSRRGLVAWTSGFGLFGVVGLADFYRWLWTFGHTVDPYAIIEIEGYTPPMLGSSTFMNFYIAAYPGVGAYALVGGLLLAVAALLVSRRRGGAARRAVRRPAGSAA